MSSDIFLTSFSMLHLSIVLEKPIGLRNNPCMTIWREFPGTRNAISICPGFEKQQDLNGSSNFIRQCRQSFTIIQCQNSYRHHLGHELSSVSRILYLQRPADAPLTFRFHIPFRMSSGTEVKGRSKTYFPNSHSY